MQTEIEAISESERQEIVSRLREFRDLEETGSLMPYLFESDISDNDVELRFFPTGDNSSDEGPVTGIYFEVTIYRESDWYENLSAYGKANMRNGGSEYNALENELSDIISEVMNQSVHFIANKGSDTFTAELTI